jgi:acyl carrier protein
MSEMSVDQFYAVLSAVLRKKSFKFEMSMTADDIPGWDSLRHVVLIMELNRVARIELSPEETARLRDLGALYQAARAAPPTG